MNDIIFKTILLKGEAGNNIGSIEKTATSGVVDTYTITLTDGTTTSFNVTNGSNIASIQKTATSGLVDTYTITLTNGDTSTFEVVNGADGANANLAPTERNNTASKSYSVGEHLVTSSDGLYYKVTSAISVGDTLVENTNIEKKYVSEEIEDIYNSFSNALTTLKNTAIAQAVGAIGSTFTSVISKLGEIVDRGNVSRTLTPNSSYTIPKGYHAGAGTVTANPNTGTYSVTSNGTHDMGIDNLYRYVNVNVPILSNGYSVAGGACTNTTVSNAVSAGRYLIIVVARTHGGQFGYPQCSIEYSSGSTLGTNTAVYVLDNNKWVRHTWAIIDASELCAISCITSGVTGDFGYGEYNIFKIV